MHFITFDHSNICAIHVVLLLVLFILVYRWLGVSILLVASFDLYVQLNVCRCNLEDILLEMDRILRPEGAVIFRDEVDVLIKVKKITAGMRWDTKMVDHEDGPLVPEKVLVAVKQYWVVGGNTTSAQ